MLQAVSIVVSEMALEQHTSCRYDSVSLYDGSSDNSPLLGTFCTVVPPTIISSGPSLFVVFQTDDSVNTGGFSLSWTFVRQGRFIKIIFDRHFVVQSIGLYNAYIPCTSHFGLYRALKYRNVIDKRDIVLKARKLMFIIINMSLLLRDVWICPKSVTHVSP